jgi:uncharacterized protein (TIGR00251 family)
MEKRIQVKANAIQNEILAESDEFLKIAIAAPAYDGKANQELIKFLRKEKGWRVDIIKGKTNKNKVINIQ